MPIGSSEGVYYPDESALIADQSKNADKGTITIRSLSKPGNSSTTMPLGSPPEPAGALESSGDTNVPGNQPSTNFLGRLSLVNAFKGMIGGAKEAVQNLPENFVKNVKAIGDTATLPHDVMTGDVPAGSVQEIEKAADLAGLMVGAPAPIAAKAADGTLGSFMGVKSATFDKVMKNTAEDMESRAVHPDAIHEETGTFRGADNKWRQEIDDSKMRLKEGAFEHDVTPNPQDPNLGEHTVKVKSRGGMPPAKPEGTEPEDYAKWFRQISEYNKSKTLHLDEVIDHPELFKAYPELRGINIKHFPTSIGGYSTETGGSLGMAKGRDIYLAPLEANMAKNILMHEIQHHIQNIEGFASGGSSEMFRPPGLDEAEVNFHKVAKDELEKMIVKGYTAPFLHHSSKRIQRSLESGSPLSEIEGLDAESFKKLTNIVKANKLLDDAAEVHLREYSKLMGEVESRNVEARMKYSKTLRELVPPQATEDIPRELQRDVPPDYRIPSRAEPIPFRRGANDNIAGLYNPREPNIIGSKEMDDALDRSWKKMGEDHNKFIELYDKLHAHGEYMAQKGNWTELNVAKYNKLGRELSKHQGTEWTPVEFNPLK